MNLTKNEIVQAIAAKTKMTVADLKSWTVKKGLDGHIYYSIGFDAVKGRKVYEGRFYAQPLAKRGRNNLETYLRTSVSPVRENEAKTVRYRKTGSTVR